MSVNNLILEPEVQEALPCLESSAYLNKFSEYNQAKPLKYPRTQDNVKESLIAIALSLCNHEKRSDIWKREVCLAP